LARSCELGNETSGPIWRLKRGFIGQLRDYKLLRKGSAPCVSCFDLCILCAVRDPLIGRGEALRSIRQVDMVINTVTSSALSCNWLPTGLRSATGET
jgi:hypothetical protein